MNDVIKLADTTNHMKHYSVEDMLEEALAMVKKDPKSFSKAYIILRQDEEDGERTMHHARAGFINDHESAGYLMEAIHYRGECLREGEWGD